MSDTQQETPHAVVTYDNGDVQRLDIARPQYALEASRIPAANETEQGFVLAWCAAGRPEGSLDEWIRNVASLEILGVSDETPTAQAGTS